MYLQEIMNPDSMPQLTGIKNNLRVISEWFQLFAEQITEAWVTERRQEQMKNSKKKNKLNAGRNYACRLDGMEPAPGAGCSKW